MGTLIYPKDSSVMKIPGEVNSPSLFHKIYLDVLRLTRRPPCKKNLIDFLENSCYNLTTKIKENKQIRYNIVWTSHFGISKEMINEILKLGVAAKNKSLPPNQRLALTNYDVYGNKQEDSCEIIPEQAIQKFRFNWSVKTIADFQKKYEICQPIYCDPFTFVVARKKGHERWEKSGCSKAPGI